MNKIICWTLFFLNCFVLTHFSQENDDTILEKVKVVNVEVPIRVVFKGKPVDTLKKSDFRLYEDKKPVEINGFFIKRKRIQVGDIRLESSVSQSYKPRYFVLVFNIIDYNFHLKDGLNFIFKNVLRENDQLMILANNKIIFYTSLKNKKDILKKVEFILKKQGLIAKANLLSYLHKFENELYLLSHKSVGGTHYMYYDFLKYFLESWREYKRRYLNADIDKYYNFASHLQKTKKEKWVINFSQLELFPQLKIHGILKEIDNLIGMLEVSEDGERKAFARILRRMLYKIPIEMNVENLFPTEEISKLFCNVGATFHSVFIPTTVESLSSDFEYKRVASALQNNLREITRRTGGTLITTHNLESAVKSISEKKDIYYILTYVPHDPSKAGKIKVKVKDKRYKLFYDDNIRADYIEEYLKAKETKITSIEIKSTGFEKNIFFFDLTGIMLKETNGVKKGIIKIHILVKDKNNKTVYDKSKIIYPAQKGTNIKINMDWLRKGRYNILVEAEDLLTGKSHQEYIQAEINEAKTKTKQADLKHYEMFKPGNRSEEGREFESRELEKYLTGAAEYCKKLTEKAFHFICKEKVTVSNKVIAPDKKTRSPYLKLYRQSTIRYLFDYQMLHQNNQINEHRKLISKVSEYDKKLSVHKLVSSFLCERAVFGPRTLLSENRQHMFRYKIVKIINNKNQRLVIIEVIPKKAEEVFFSSGKVWIDASDFSVKKIQVTPRYIQGYENLLKIANLYQARLIVDCQMEYDQEYNGLYFPTEVIIIERYKGGMSIVREFGSKGWERTRTLFTYQDYKFFNVNVDVLEN